MLHKRWYDLFYGILLVKFSSLRKSIRPLSWLMLSLLSKCFNHGSLTTGNPPQARNTLPLKSPSTASTYFSAVLFVDGKKIATTRIDKTQPNLYSADETADVGVDNQTPVALGIGYGPAETRFTGTINKLTIEVE
jgi:hypothetical protein